MIYGAILDGAHSVERSAASARSVVRVCGGSCGGRWLVVVVAASHEAASEPPATLGLIVVEGSQTIVGRPIREEHAPEERGEVFYSQTDQKYHKCFHCQ